MLCPQCHTDNPETAKFCLECGARLALLCPECATPLPAGAKFCLQCGARLEAIPAPPVEPPSDTIPERIRRLMPAEYVERLLASGGRMAGERRLVTILFSDVKGSTAMAEKLDPEEVMEIMNGAFDVLIEPIMRHEGTLARLMGDAILAFFGAPIAHEDDPERACRAALEIVAGAQEYGAKLEEERGIKGFGVRVGINTGLVVVGEVGSDLRVEYTAMGDAINLAARMEQHAPIGGILITHDTYRHVRGIFDVQPQEPLQVKGKAEPIQTYVMLQAKPRAFRLPTRGVEGIETRMIGREAELKWLQDGLYDAIEDRERQMVTIVGDAGVGKSRLLYEFDNWLELLPQTVRYFKGRARQEMQSTPYALLRDLFAFRFRIQDSDSAEVVRHKMVRGVGEVLGDDEQAVKKAHLMGHLIGFDFSHSPYLQALLDDPRALHEQALAHLQEFFSRSCALNPTILLLEDLHWADDSSLDVINHLAEVLPNERLLIVAAARPSLFERRPHWGEGQTFHTRLDLQPLSRRDGRRLVAEILQKVDQVPSTLRDLVVIGAEGNPFFIEELIKMLIEDNVIVKPDGDAVIVKGAEAWRVETERLAEVRVPESLTEVLQARLDRLPLEERTILQQASVVGRLFWDRAVAHIGETAREGLGEVKVVNGLAALRDREMVFRRETSAFAEAREFIFKHALLREITYASVLKRLRKVYHGLVADWLVEEAGERVREITGLIADHLEAAGRTEEAVERLLEAGDRARLLYAHEPAIGYYQRALDLQKKAQQHEHAARTLMKLGLTYHTAFDFENSRHAYDEGAAMWRQAGQLGLGAPLTPAPQPLRVAWLDRRSMIDPYIGGFHQLFSGLARLTPEWEVLPNVARSWEVREGGRHYILYLRDDVLWSDGRPVTARDFEYGWKRTLHPRTASLSARLLYDIRGASPFHQGRSTDPESIGVRALDDLTLSVQLEEPTGSFLHLLACSATNPLPKHLGTAGQDASSDVANPVTNGPFQLEAWNRSESLICRRYEAYHDAFRGNVACVELVLDREPGGGRALATYEDDKLDIMELSAVSPARKQRLRQRYPDDYFTGPSMASAVCLAFDVTRPPFSDPRVRRACVYALDRAEFMNVIGQGTFLTAMGGLVPPGMAGHWAGTCLSYDPAQAQELLAEAGYPAGVGFPVVRTPWTDGRHHRLLADWLRKAWSRDLGITVEFEICDVATYQSRVRSEPARLFTFWHEAEYPDPDCLLRVGIPWDRVAWRDEAYHSLVEKARRVLDQAERMRLYERAQRRLAEDAAIMPFGYWQEHVLIKPWVRKPPLPASAVFYWQDVIMEPHR